jgi:hypothetical protein
MKMDKSQLILIMFLVFLFMCLILAGLITRPEIDRIFNCLEIEDSGRTCAEINATIEASR